jgi:hypothetical protein
MMVDEKEKALRDFVTASRLGSREAETLIRELNTEDAP